MRLSDRRRNFLINKVCTLPNYCNGKLYKRWNSVRTLFGNGTIFASKTTKDNKTVQLMISDWGKKRELFTSDCKVTDIIGDNKYKYTYIYRKTNEDEIKGSMFHSAPKFGKDAPLINAAKWILRNFIPEKLFLKLNTDNPNSRVFVPAKFLKRETSEFFGTGKCVTANEILAKDFYNRYAEGPLPRIIMIRTTDRDVEVIEQISGEDNAKLSEKLGIISKELGNNIRTIV